ncbi:MAG: GntR family transcriptional regulator [Lachnospiraceae bacterium]|nr:GntR family transcriptional regulator [Lachnospiraceae bacterium]
MNEFGKEHENDFLPLRDVVFNTLRQSILTGELKPGERLMEIHLADKLGVSRTPIREAIRKLELEGLVTMIPRRGAEVAQITEKSLRDVLEVRRALDALAAELACERITEEKLEQLRAACDNFEAETRKGNANQVALADVAFHDIILEASGNDKLVQMISNFSQQMYRYRLEYVKDEGNYEQLIQEHRVIYESILKRDKAVAAGAMKVHIDNQEKAVIRMISQKKKK